MEAISREGYLAYSGHKQSAELQPIYEKHERIFSRDALELTMEAFTASPPGSEERRSARNLLEWQIESQASKPLAPLDEREIEWENAAVVRSSDGQVVSYQAVPIEIANMRDRPARLALDAARANLVLREHAPLRQERLQREKEYIESIGIASDYNTSFEAVSGISLSRLAAECEEFLRDTQAMWDDSLPRVLKKSLGIRPEQAKRSDALALFRASEFDEAFPANAMEAAIKRQISEMGVDPTAQGRIVFDLGERQGKRARAFCSPVRVPQEVYLVLRPHGGQSDYNTMLHEIGHALHFAYARADYPFEFRWLGDNSVTESYAMLLDHRMQDGRWLLRYTSLEKKRLGKFLRAAGFEELHFLRRYCAKLLYEREVYGGELGWDQLPDLYVSRLTSATGFEYSPADAFVDIDPGYYSARYLRAWQLQSVLDEHLVRNYDDDWFRNPRAGRWIVGDLFAQAQRETAEEVAMRGGASSLSFAPLVRKIEQLLVA